jgi:hypothetical protein
MKIAALPRFRFYIGARTHAIADAIFRDDRHRELDIGLIGHDGRMSFPIGTNRLTLRRPGRMQVRCRALTEHYAGRRGLKQRKAVDCIVLVSGR